MGASSHRLSLSQEQLARAQAAFAEPIDWSDLYLYSFYALENAVVAAAEALALPWTRNHPSKVELAGRLHEDHPLPDVRRLLRELNELRKSVAYGEEPQTPTVIDPEEILAHSEEFIEAVVHFVSKRGEGHE